MPLDVPPQNIALGVQVPNGFQNISGMLNLANQAQQYKAGNVELQKQQIMLGERKGIQDLFQHPEQFTGEDGQPDYNKLINEGMKVAPTTFPTMVPQIIAAHRDSIAASAAMNNLNNDQRAAVGQYVMSLGNDDPATAKQKLTGLVAQNPGLAPAVNFAWKYHLAPNSSNPDAFKNAALKLGQAAMAPAQQAAAMTPSGPMMTNQAQSAMVNVNPMAGPTGVVPGTIVNNQIPLSERQNVSINPVTQSPMTVAKDAFGNVVGVTTTPTGPGVPSLAPGQPQAVQANAGTAAEDWKQTFSSGQRASQDIGVLQEMKKYAPGAVTGVAQDRRAFIAGLAGLLGMDTAQLEKTDTDLLAKNSNMLALAGGDTNLAKQLAEVANPNVHMTKEAITKAANQVIAQKQLQLVRAQHLQQFANDPQAYTQEATKFNAMADPRVLQYPSLSDAERNSMVKAMSPQEQTAFIQKLRFFQQNGYLR